MRSCSPASLVSANHDWRRRSESVSERSRIIACAISAHPTSLVFQRGALQQASFLFKHALVQETVYGTFYVSRGPER